MKHGKRSLRLLHYHIPNLTTRILYGVCFFLFDTLTNNDYQYIRIKQRKTIERRTWEERMTLVFLLVLSNTIMILPDYRALSSLLTKHVTILASSSLCTKCRCHRNIITYPLYNTAHQLLPDKPIAFPLEPCIHRKCLIR